MKRHNILGSLSLIRTLAFSLIQQFDVSLSVCRSLLGIMADVDDFGFPNLHITFPDPPKWTLATELSEQRRNDFTTHSQEMLDHYNEFKGTNFEFVRLVKLQTLYGRGADHFFQFEVKPSGAADHTLKTFEVKTGSCLEEIRSPCSDSDTVCKRFWTVGKKHTWHVSGNQQCHCVH
nr:hypothetical protein CFP56_47255 [Quercus suber]